MSRRVRNYDHKLLKILDDFHLLVFQHLEPLDTINLTAVDPDLNTKISTCAHCMCQIVLHISLETFLKQRDLMCLTNSVNRRDYRNVRLSCGNDNDLSFICSKILLVYSNTIINLNVHGMKLMAIDDEENEEFSMPKLMKLKILSVDRNSMVFLLRLSRLCHKVTIQDICWTIDDPAISSLIMRFCIVKLLNVQITSLTNIDFMFNNCLDFELDYDQLNDFSSLCSIFQNALNCTELTITRKDKSNENSNDFRLTVHRFKGSVGNLSPKMFDRRYSRKTVGLLINEIANGRKRKNDKLDENSNFQQTKFGISLAIDELNWTILEKLGKVLTNLNSFKIFNISEKKKIEIFKNFKSLQLITIEKVEEMESESYFARSEYEIKKSRDPILLFNDQNLRSLIFQHLNLDDFLQSSEVSSKWNNITSENSNFNSKIIFTLENEDFFDKNHLKDPLKSKSVCNEIMNSKKYVENLKISGDLNPKMILSMSNLIHHFSRFLVELHFKDIKMKSGQILNYLIFPKLKVLKLINVDDNFCKMMFTNLSTLEVLDLESLNFCKKFRSRLQNQKNLKKFYIRNCTWMDFKADEKEFAFEFLEFLEISFYQANSWLAVKNRYNLDTFLDSSTFSAVKSLKVAGIRGKNLTRILNKLKNLKNLELKGFWASDFEEMEICFHKINLYVPNFYHLDEFPWQKKFRHLQTILSSTIEKPSFVNFFGNDRKFKKMLGVSASKLINKKIYQLDNSSMDPLTKLPEDVHELIFQHLRGKDAMNLIEVSQNWKVYGAQTKNLMAKIELKVSRGDETKIEEELFNNILQKFQIVTIDSPKLKLVKNFSKYIKKISISIEKERDFSEEGFDFLNVEILELPKDYYGSTQKVEDILKLFEDCRKLKVFINKIQQTREVIPLTNIILKQNSNLTELRLDNCVEYKKFFKEDFSNGFDFKLKKLSIGIPNNESIYNTVYESNILKFLKVHKETLEEFSISHSSAHIVNEIFLSFKKLTTFYMTYFIGYDYLFGSGSESIKKFSIPLSSIDGSQVLIHRIPMVEFLHIYGIDLDILRCVALNLAYLKLLTYSDERNNCTRHYEHIVADNELVNRTLRFKKVERSRFDSVSFKSLFGVREEDFDD